MSSGFSGDYFSGSFAGRSRRPYTAQLPELNPDPTSQILHRLPVIPGKRSLAEFQAQHQQNQALSFYLRNVKARSSPSILGYPISRQNTEIAPNFLNYPNLVPNRNATMMNTLQMLDLPISRQIPETTPSFLNYPNLVPNNQRMLNNLQELDLPVSRQFTETAPNFFNYPNLVPNRNDKMLNKLQELEKHLLDDDEGDDSTSVVTNSEWSDTFQHLIGPPQQHQPHTLSLSPTSSCSSCCSSPPILSPKQTLIEAATAISENKPDLARDILTRLSQTACVTGTAEQRLTSYFCDALRARVGSTRGSDARGENHALATQMLYDASPCFKLGFMAANLAILEATSASDADVAPSRIHVIDFEIGRGGQYAHLIHALAARNKLTPLKITAVTEFGYDVDQANRVGDGLQTLATKVGVSLTFVVSSLKATDLSRERLRIEGEDKLAVNLSFKLFKLADESVTTENPRDELLRRVKGLSPMVVTVVEQEMNTNTAPFLARVSEACDYYGNLFDSFDYILARDNSDRVRIEEGLSRKLANSVVCEGRERVERCEVFGKWRARMGMAGFKMRPMGRPVLELLLGKLGGGTRGNPGFSVKEENGGILLGWKERTLTVASAWE